MDTRHLEEHFHELVSHMESAGYGKPYIKKLKTEYNWIIRRSVGNSWGSYEDVYLERALETKSEGTLHMWRAAIAILERFDLHGVLPDGVRRKSSITDKCIYLRLAPQYRELIDHYCRVERQRGGQESAALHPASIGSSFLYAMQLRGCSDLSQIAEEDVLSHFFSEDGDPVRGYATRDKLAEVLKACADRYSECSRILLCLPMLRKKRKNIQYLTPEEISEIKALLANEESGLSLRDRAIGQILLLTALRSCDVAALRVDSFDWRNDRITIVQQKTGAPLTLPLSPVVGNAVYDYLASERPPSSEPWLFLGERRPHSKLKSRSIGNVVAKMFRLVEIRQQQGDRKGTHIFRHSAVATMLGSGVSRPVISRTLGHTSPESLEPYLGADFAHLKECAIGIEAFPVSEEVFALW